MNTRIFQTVIFHICATVFVVGQSFSLDVDGLAKRVDSLMEVGMVNQAFPGAQMMVVLNDSVVFHKTYGYHTYDRQNEVQGDDLYDLASVTKVSTGLSILMKGVSDGVIDIYKPWGHYLKFLKRTDKYDLPINKILAHEAGLQPYIIYYQDAKKDDGSFKRRTFREKPNRKYRVKIGDHLYLHRRYYKKMYKAIKESPVTLNQGYKYSGLFFQLLPEMLEKTYKTDFESLYRDEILKPCGIRELMYNPLEKGVSLDRIIPTEIDTSFRRQLVHGVVHDEAAAMLKGVSCNAGLFGTANGLRKLFSMYLNNGECGGQRIIKKEVLEEFTSYQSEEHRRGLGFDKPEHMYDEALSYVAQSASKSSYGHSGFTGTMVWADPEYDLIFILLSNRVYPHRSHRNLYRLNLRPQLHQAVYDYLSEN